MDQNSPSTTRQTSPQPLPTIRAQLSLNHKDPLKAVEVLRVAAPYELATLYPVYMRGLAYLAAQ
jgi:hypothetical protein